MRIAKNSKSAPLEPVIPPACAQTQKEERQARMFTTHDVLRMPGNKLQRGFRAWKVMGVVLGGTGQEDHYQLLPLDRMLGNSIEKQYVESLVPCWMLETHPDVEKV